MTGPTARTTSPPPSRLAGGEAARGALLFRRRLPFDAHDRRLIATAANLLALRLF